MAVDATAVNLASGGPVVPHPRANPLASSATAAPHPSPFARLVRRHAGWGLRTLLDLAALAASWQVTFELRLALNPWMEVSFEREMLSRLAPPLSAVLCLWLVAHAYLDPRSETRKASGPFSHLLRAGEAALWLGAVVAIVTFFSREAGWNASRSFVLLLAPVSFPSLAAGRYGALALTAALEQAWPTQERLAIVGFGPQAKEAFQSLRGETGVGTQGVILPPMANGHPPSGFPVLGRLHELGGLINRHGLDRLVFLDGQVSDKEFEHASDLARRMNVVPSRGFRWRRAGTRLDVSRRAGMALVDLRSREVPRSRLLVKRTLDVVGSASLLMLMSPLMAATAVLVKLSSPGPVFYRAPRVGKGGRHFVFLKFRTMYHEQRSRQQVEDRNEREGHIFKIRHDPRITPAGAWMRRYSLDEVPQLINVLMGQMSLVGPRPLPADDLEPDGKSLRFATWAERRSRVMPGISGLWQIRGRSRLDFQRMVELDLEYVRDWSLGLDVKILLATPLAVMSGDGAY